MLARLTKVSLDGGKSWVHLLTTYHSEGVSTSATQSVVRAEDVPAIEASIGGDGRSYSGNGRNGGLL